MPVSEILELYSRCGRSLINNGLKEAALPLSEAAHALDLFFEHQWVVLGGDIYKEGVEGRMESTYENWFYEGGDPKESAVVARNYLSSFTSGSLSVVFVVECRPPSSDV
jgi:hypothetical protein